jgi:hypothetical protein
MPEQKKELPIHEKEQPKKNYFRFAYLVAAYIPVLLPVTGLLRVLLYLILFAATSYYIINFFSRLTGINMFSAYAWSLQTPGGAPMFLFPLTAGICFTMSFSVMIALLRVPSQVVDLKNNNVCGLIGYRDAQSMLWLYDPPGNAYISYNDNTFQAAPERFTDLFKIVLLYKGPGDKFYYDTEFLGLSPNLSRVFFIVLFLSLIYPLLYYLAGFYIKYHCLDAELTHQSMLTRYREIAGIHPAFAGAIAIALLLAVPVYSMVSVNKLMSRYMNTQGVQGDRLKNEVLKNASPGTVLKGSVILRRVNIESVDTTDKESLNRRRTHSHSATYIYTVKFQNLTEIPVYLRMPIDYGDEKMKMLEKAFPDQKTASPDSVKEYDFIVNDDYSVMVKSEE